MAEPRTVAFVVRPESLKRLPSQATVLPLDPSVAVPSERRLARRPEDLLSPPAAEAIEATTRRLASTWWRAAPDGAFVWRGVNLAECFTYDLQLAVRDAVKTAYILDEAMARVRSREVFTDVAPIAGAFPSYPNLAALGSLLETRARSEGWNFTSLASSRGPPASPGTSGFARAYLSVAARRGLAELRRGRPLVALGPYPDFYRPTADAWRRRRGSVVVVTRSGSPIRAAPKFGLFVLPLDVLVQPEEREEIQKAVVRAIEAIENVGGDSFSPVGRWALAPVLRTHLASRASTELAGMAAIGVAYERALERSTGAVAVETLSPLAQAFVRFARGKGVPVTVIQHGILAGTFSYRQTLADRVAAWGPTDAEWFRSHLDGSPRVEPTGCPRYDGLVRVPPAPAGRSGGGTVLFASQPLVVDRAMRSAWDRHEALEMAIEATVDIVGLRLRVKWHPAEENAALPPSAERLGARVESMHGGNTFELVRQSDVVLAMSSTVALEAMFLGRPVVFLGPADSESPFRPPEDGGGLRAHNPEELRAHLGALLEDQVARAHVLAGQQAYLARHYAPLDGRAAERVADLLRQR